MRENRLKLKVCGMREAENIIQLVQLKPDYMGFIFYAPSKRYVRALEQSTLDSIPSHVKKTGVFVNAALEEVNEKIDTYKLDAVQLHGNESPELCESLRAKKVEIIKAFGIDKDFDFGKLAVYSKVADYFLFDTKTDLHGGSGNTFDWSILEGYTLDVPYFLSGGLSIENIGQVKSINDPKLYALDLNSRFELEPAVKDINKLTTVFNEIRTPF